MRWFKATILAGLIGLAALPAHADSTAFGVGLQTLGAVNTDIANASSTGTTLNTLTKFVNGQALISATSDTVYAAGVCMSGCGTTGTATIARVGNAQLLIDAAHTPTAGHFVQISATNAGYGSDTGAATCPGNAGQVIGLVQSNVSGSIYNVQLGAFGCSTSLTAGQSSITEYISHGSSTYTVPTNAAIVRVIVCGAAGGGSSGAPQAVSTNAVGGSGGGTGSCIDTELTAAQAGATMAVVVGQGGGAGAISTTLNTPNNGSDGANSTVTPAGTGPVLTGYHGGGGGTGLGGKGASCAAPGTGTTSPTLTCIGASANGAGYPYFAGLNGNAGLITAGTPTTNVQVSVNYSGVQGAGGGGINGTGVTANIGGFGQATLAETSFPAGGTAGTSTGGTGGNGASPTAWMPGLGAGSSGGGGGACITNPCTGGPAGTSGLLAGGGGGGASVGTSGSGAGSAGGDGAVWIEAKF